MKKLDKKILNLPPFISTSWKNVNTLHVKEIDGKQVLMVILHNGTSIEVPRLEKMTLNEIFEAHAKFLEGEEEAVDILTAPTSVPSKESDISFSFGLPFPSEGGNTGTQGFGSVMEHDPSRADSPDLPSEVLEKTTGIWKAIGMDFEKMNMPKAEPHCNCFYCQIAKAIENGLSDKEPEEEIVLDEELTFKDWEIRQEGDKLFIVSNPLNAEEHYQVFLGSPVGCTCGQTNCEHIRTVLNS